MQFMIIEGLGRLAGIVPERDENDAHGPCTGAPVTTLI